MRPLLDRSSHVAYGTGSGSVWSQTGPLRIHHRSRHTWNSSFDQAMPHAAAAGPDTDHGKQCPDHCGLANPSEWSSSWIASPHVDAVCPQSSAFCAHSVGASVAGMVECKRPLPADLVSLHFFRSCTKRCVVGHTCYSEASSDTLGCMQRCLQGCTNLRSGNGFGILPADNGCTSISPEKWSPSPITSWHFWIGCPKSIHNPVCVCAHSGDV